MSEEEHNASGFWLGLILGGAIGTIAGYLLNSKDKKEALREIAEKGRELFDNLADFKDEVIEKGGGVKEVVEAEVAEVVEEVKEAKKEVAAEAQGIPQAAKEAIEKVEKAAEEAVKNISESVKASHAAINPKKKGFGKIFFKKGQPLVKK